MNGDEPMLAAANDLRATISDLLEVPHSDRIILAPGILVALRTLFSHLHIERIALTSEEYYGEEHFPAAAVRAASCDALFDPGLTGDCEAVVASPASWRGTRQPVAELFDSIRKQLDKRAPLLIADYAHAVDFVIDNYLGRKFLGRISKDKETPSQDTTYMVNPSKRPSLEYYKNMKTVLNTYSDLVSKHGGEYQRLSKTSNLFGFLRFLVFVGLAVMVIIYITFVTN